jgi:RNA polymerase sigma factor (TIGR02999 family)
MRTPTEILAAIQQGDPQGLEELLPLVYDELRRLAARKVANEALCQTLQATALVHEAFLRLFDHAQRQNWANRKHFFAAAAEAMRRILIENARRKNARKRGGSFQRKSFEQAEIAAPRPSEDVEALSEALDKLEKFDNRLSTIVKLRYFVGLTVDETAEVMGIPKRSTDRLWAYARAWLHEELTRV